MKDRTTRTIEGLASYVRDLELVYDSVCYALFVAVDEHLKGNHGVLEYFASNHELLVLTLSFCSQEAQERFAGIDVISQALKNQEKRLFPDDFLNAEKRLKNEIEKKRMEFSDRFPPGSLGSEMEYRPDND